MFSCKIPSYLSLWCGFRQESVFMKILEGAAYAHVGLLVDGILAQLSIVAGKIPQLSFHL